MMLTIKISRISSYRAMIGLLSTLIAALALAGCNQELAAKRDALKVQIERLQKQLATAQAERAQWQAKHAEADQRLLTIRQELQAEITRRTEALQQARIQYEDKSLQVEAMQSAQGAFRAEISQLQSELNRLEHRLQTVQSERETLQRQYSQVQSDLQLAQQESVYEQNGHEDAATEMLAAMLEELTGLRQVVETSRPSQTDIRRDLQAVLRPELSTLKTAIAQQTAKRFEETQTALQTQLARHRLELAAQRERLQQMSGEREVITAQTRQLQRELNRYKSADQSQQHRLNHLYDVTTAKLQASLSSQAVALEPGTDRILLRVGGSILFDPGQVILRAEGRRTLDDVAAILTTFPSSTIRLEGHTDDRPIKGAAKQRFLPTNWELSALRAASAARYLETRGVAPERMIVSGASFHHPLASNDTPEGRAQNRRLEITIRPN